MPGGLEHQFQTEVQGGGRERRDSWERLRQAQERQPAGRGRGQERQGEAGRCREREGGLSPMDLLLDILG